MSVLLSFGIKNICTKSTFIWQNGAIHSQVHRNLIHRQSSSFLLAKQCHSSNGMPCSSRIQTRSYAINPADDPHPNKPDKMHVKMRTFGFSWKRAFATLSLGGAITLYMLWLRKKKDEEIERKRRISVGKYKIGGDWELLNASTGKMATSQDYKGKWLLIYFGFTHCPDICPDEMEKMGHVVDLLDKRLKSNKRNDIEIVPLFFTVDPERDKPAIVKKYVEEFSPRMVGFTGTMEQVNKVTKAFRVYHSQGPRDDNEDYIVDHTIMMFLMDPEGKFVEYYGKNRNAEQIAGLVEGQMFKFHGKKGWF